MTFRCLIIFSLSFCIYYLTILTHNITIPTHNNNRYCFGGTGVLYYALQGSDDDVKGIVSIHGGLNSEILNATNVEIDAIRLSGQKVKTIFTGKNQESGFYQSSESIYDLKSGVYIIRLNAGSQSKYCKIIIQKK